MNTAQDRSLSLVPAAGAHTDARAFCGHCGRAPERSAEALASRVCARCGMGLILYAAPEAAPAARDPFLVVDSSLAICAVSRRAERLLGVTETEAVNRHVTQYLVPAGPEAPASTNLVALLTWATRSEVEPRSVIVRPADTFGVRFWARVASCGPPAAGLVVLANAA